MTESAASASPRPHDRAAGLFYLLTMVAGVASLAVGGNLIVTNDAAATATNILTHEVAYRLYYVANLIADLSYVVVTALFYHLFKPVNRSLSLTAAFVSVVGCSLGAVSNMLDLTPFSLLKDAAYASSFQAGQAQALAYTFLRVGNQAYSTGLVFFGIYCLSIGTLIFRSTFLPRWIGLAMMFAGLGWLTHLWPPLSRSLGMFGVLPGFVGEGSLTVWLLVKGVNLERWRARAAASD